AVYGEEGAPDELSASAQTRSDFKPWHHPVKQVVRNRQWAALTKRLIERRPGGGKNDVLRYFTLPGEDLFDVKVLTESCPDEMRVQYFGFNSAIAKDSRTAQESAGPIWTEAALVQAGKAAAMAIVLPDRLEDIAIAGSHA